MSIFKGTISPRVAWQLAARKNVIKQTSRDAIFAAYTTGKNSWVKMSSFVNADIPARNSKGEPIPDIFRYQGDELSRKYILQGGVLYENSNQTFLRGGVGKYSAVYGSDIDKLFSQYREASIEFGGQKDVNVQNIYSNRPFGLRPMPGISSVQITNKSAYGSLREATVKYYCWDKHQLEELELLYMRVGYSVLLEWGWSHYLDYQTNNLPSTDLNTIDFDKSNVSITLTTTSPNDFIDPFNSDLTDDKIYKKIDDKITTYKSNYDAMLGIIKNFSWQIMPNGGYECTTILISRGEILSSLRLTNSGDKHLDNTGAGSSNTEPPLTIFEKIFYNLQAAINNKELSDSLGSFYVNTSPPPPTPLPTPPGFKTDQVILPTAQIVINKILVAAVENLKNYFDAFGKPYKPYITTTGSDDKIGVMNFINGSSTEGTGNEYISLNLFIYILNIFFTLRNETDDNKKESFVKLILPQGTPCLASRNSVSVDPTTCLIKNSKASLITGGRSGAFSPNLYFSDGTEATTYVKEFLMDGNRGDIGSILVSIDKLTTLFNDSNQGPDGVIMVDYIQRLLDDISAALGGINDFKLFSDKGYVQIIDAKYLEQDNETNKNKKYKLDLFGLDSICRDVKITSRIFEEQSTMIAIGAQGQGNLGDIYSSTYNYLNQGLTDRLHPSKPLSPSDIDKLAIALFPDLRTLFTYLENKCIGDIRNDPTRTKNYVLSVNPEEIPTATSIYKTFQLRIAGEDIDYKDLIPFELEITLDGISGFIQGQIFKVDNKVLPSDYINKNVGLVITGINHTLQNNDWTTTLKTQVVLLDQEALANQNPNKDLQSRLEKTLGKLIEKDKVNNIIWTAVADYVAYLTTSIFKWFAGSGGDNTFLTTGEYVVATAVNGIGMTKNQLETYYVGSSPFKNENDFGKYIVQRYSGAQPKYNSFQSYYKDRWYPHAIASTTIPPDDKALIPLPATIGSRSPYVGFTYKYIDSNNDIQDGTLAFDINKIVVNSGQIDPLNLTLPYDLETDPYGTAKVNQATGGRFFSFLDRRNISTNIYAPSSTDRGDNFLYIPQSGNIFKMATHPYIKPNGSGDYLLDTSRLQTSGSITYIDMNQVVNDSILFIQSIGSIVKSDTIGASNVLLNPNINPNSSTFMGYSVEVEKAIGLFTDPTLNPSGTLPLVFITK